MAKFNSDIAFTPAVKRWQEKEGSRTTYELMAKRRDWQSKITTNLLDFIAQRDSFYLATTNSNGQPYIQHRGGPKGFLKAIDEETLGFVDYAGNKQYISAGNLSENDKVHLFLMDYPNQVRIKIWGEAKIVEDNTELVNQLRDEEYKAKNERVILIKVKAWDVNCPQHIKRRFSLEEIQPEIDKLKARIVELENLLENKGSTE